MNSHPGSSSYPVYVLLSRLHESRVPNRELTLTEQPTASLQLPS